MHHSVKVSLMTGDKDEHGSIALASLACPLACAAFVSLTTNYSCLCSQHGQTQLPL